MAAERTPPAPSDQTATIGDSAGSAAGSPASRGRPRVLAIVLYAVGVALLVAAVWAAWRGIGAGRGLEVAAEHATPGLVALVLLLPGANWLLTTAAFWRLTRRYGRVGVGEMGALLGAAWLLNHLPMRPGLVGRVAYHKAVNGIPIRNSTLVVAQALACAGVAAGVLLIQVVVAQASGSMTSAATIGVSLALAAAWGAVRFISARRTDHAAAHTEGGAVVTQPLTPAVLDVALVRYADTLVWAVRYMVAFRLAGEEIGPQAAIAIALVSQAAMMMPIQFGLREWVVGLTAASLPAVWVAASGDAAPPIGEGGEAMRAIAPGLLADLIGRAAELAWAIPAGLVSAWWLARRRRRLRAAAPVDPAP